MQIWAREKIVSNRGEFGPKMIAPRVDHASYNITLALGMICIVFAQKPKRALQGANLGPSKNCLQSRRFSRRLGMICIDFCQNPKMAHQGANLSPSKNSLQSRRFWAQNDRGHVYITIHTILALIWA